MYKIARSKDLWKCRESYPDIFLNQFKTRSLKPLGHATIIEYVNKHFIESGKTCNVLEIGHGGDSPFFKIFSNSDKIKCYGIDDYDKDNTVSISALEKLRALYTNVTFYNGYLGGGYGGAELPSDFFDLVFSVSVVEHIPTDSLKNFNKDIFRILRPGGLQIHSYDRPWGGDVKIMKEAIDNEGFLWIEEGSNKRDISDFWKIDPKELARIVFENPYIVMENFCHNQPRENRELYNWVTVLVGAKKPL
jgi:SAM-dependent methyltransferase